MFHHIYCCHLDESPLNEYATTREVNRTSRTLLCSASPDRELIWKEMKQLQNVNLVLTINRSEEKLLKISITYITLRRVD